MAHKTSLRDQKAQQIALPFDNNAIYLRPMSTNSNILESQSKEDTKRPSGNCLILYNDNKNTFEHVIDCLINICNHDTIQAEQCAYIANYRGKCDVKKGEYKYLKELKDVLIENGLIVSIE